MLKLTKSQVIQKLNQQGGAKYMAKLFEDATNGRMSNTKKALNSLPEWIDKVEISYIIDSARGGKIDVSANELNAYRVIRMYQKLAPPAAKILDAEIARVNKRNSSGPPWMATAIREIGQAEVSGKKANPRILEYFKASKFWGTDDSGGANAWCASFVAWVLQQHGHTPVKNSFRAREWENFGKKLANPVYGAIGVKSRKGGGHVAFVVGKSTDGAHLYMLGGNQQDRVQVSKYPKSVWKTFVVPASYDASQAVLPIYTKSAKVAGSED